MFVSQREQARLERALEDCLRHLRAVRNAQPEWYVWVTEGQPVLEDWQYAALGKPRTASRKSA